MMEDQKEIVNPIDIVGTIGSNCFNYDILRKMYWKGMNIARFNLSHATAEKIISRMEYIAQLYQNRMAMKILFDTKGWEIRMLGCQFQNLSWRASCYFQ